jgi:sulfopropanediol 3-dehydrogenase
MTVAIDLAGQAEHGANSPVWLITTSRALAESAARIMPEIVKEFPGGKVIEAAWRNHGEIILCDSREEVCEISDRYLQVIAQDMEWCKEQLKNYGSLFQSEGANVPPGDKCSGTNHIGPAKGAARYTGGLMY